MNVLWVISVYSTWLNNGRRGVLSKPQSSKVASLPNSHNPHLCAHVCMWQYNVGSTHCCNCHALITAKRDVRSVWWFGNCTAIYFARFWGYRTFSPLFLFFLFLYEALFFFFVHLRHRRLFHCFFLMFCLWWLSHFSPYRCLAWFQ